MKDDHIIKRQILEIEFPGKDEAVHGQTMLEQLYFKDLLPVINKAFSAVAGSETVVIDSLELDLGYLDPHHLEEQLHQQLKSKLIDELHVKLRDRTKHTRSYGHNAEDSSIQKSNPLRMDENGRKTSPSRRSPIDAFIFFLDHGRLPWWSPVDTSPEQLAEIIVSDHVENATTLIETIFASDIKTQRFIYQLPDAVLLKFLSLSNASDSQLIRVKKTLENILALHERHRIAQIPSTRLRLYYWTSAFSTWGLKRNTASPDPNLALHVVLQKTEQRLQKSASENFGSDKELICLVRFISRVVETEPSGFNGGSPFENRDQSIHRFIVMLHKRLEKTGRSFNTLKNLIRTLDQADFELFKKEESRSEKKINGKLIKNGDSSKKGNYKSDSNRQSNREHSPFEENEAVEVRSAGVVILAQFLPLFFEEIGLIKDKSFISENSAIRATMILEYICTGELVMPEHDMLLHKIICGLPPETPIPGLLDISEYESEEIDNLLRSVIEHWKALKGTSLRGLRQTFLNREGLLTHESNGWSIYVERMTVDVLIDHLPWSLSIVKMPWNDDLIYVEW